MDRERMNWVIDGIDFERLTEWEENFVVQVEERFNRREKKTGQGYVTDGEEEILERIFKTKGR